MPIPLPTDEFSFQTSRSSTSGQALADALMGTSIKDTEASGCGKAVPLLAVRSLFPGHWKVGRRLTISLGQRW
jgi:hypothetical protein